MCKPSHLINIFLIRFDEDSQTKLEILDCCSIFLRVYLIALPVSVNIKLMFHFSFDLFWT